MSNQPVRAGVSHAQPSCNFPADLHVLLPQIILSLPEIQEMARAHLVCKAWHAAGLESFERSVVALPSRGPPCYGDTRYRCVTPDEERRALHLASGDAARCAAAVSLSLVREESEHHWPLLAAAAQSLRSLHVHWRYLAEERPPLVLPRLASLTLVGGIVDAALVDRILSLCPALLRLHIDGADMNRPQLGRLLSAPGLVEASCNSIFCQNFDLLNMVGVEPEDQFQR